MFGWFNENASRYKHNNQEHRIGFWQILSVATAYHEEKIRSIFNFFELSAFEGILTISSGMLSAVALRKKFTIETLQAMQLFRRLRHEIRS